MDAYRPGGGREGLGRGRFSPDHRPQDARRPASERQADGVTEPQMIVPHGYGRGRRAVVEHGEERPLAGHALEPSDQKLHGSLTCQACRATVKRRARALSVRRRLRARCTGSEREPDAPPSAGQPRSPRRPSGEQARGREGGAARRTVALRSRRPERRPHLRHGPHVRRRAAQAQWSTMRPDDQRPPGRRSRREVTPLDAAREDGPPPSSGVGSSVNPTQPGARAGARDKAAGAQGTEQGVP
jgi:hypothetical protein